MGMFYATVIPLVFLFSTLLQAQHNQWDPFSPNFNPIPPQAFQGGVFSPEWGANMAQQIRQDADAAGYSGNSVSVTTENGVTTVIANMGGKPYKATLPEGSSVSTATSGYTDHNGQQVDTFTITVNGIPYTYTTVGGRTTGPPGGGPFSIVSH